MVNALFIVCSLWFDLFRILKQKNWPTSVWSRLRHGRRLVFELVGKEWGICLLFVVTGCDFINGCFLGE